MEWDRLVHTVNLFIFKLKLKLIKEAYIRNKYKGYDIYFGELNSEYFISASKKLNT